ncbi:M28 family peptidase [Sulfolobus tengchongensis]|uniref:M28 family peptidase n=1 Tax=Sulfolobus tengchongensis TaxID=207809 RepID=A0AAX4L0F5_9CREN
MLLERLKALSKYDEIITGSSAEIKIVREIKKILEEKSDEIRTTPIRVLNWEQKDLLFECESKIIDALALPYSLSIDIEANIINNFQECNERSFIKIKIENLYEINKLYIKAVESKCAGIIFSLDNEKRKFVIKYGDLINYKPSYPPPIPAIYVRENDFINVKGKCRLLLKTDINPFATGYIIEGIKNSKDENKVIHITAHHDHWFKGERDNLLAVALMPELYSNLYETHLITFTAEESGSVYFSTFSWSHGSREFLRNYNKDIHNIIMNINLDNISEEDIIIKALPGLSAFSKKYFSNIVTTPEIYSDGYSYVKRGIPSITIESLGNTHYHGEYDIIDKGDNKALINANIIINSINRMINENIEYKLEEMQEQLKEDMKSLPVKLKSYLVNTIDLLEKNSIEMYRNILSFYGGVLSLDKPYAKVELFHKIRGLDEAKNSKDTVCIEDLGCIRKLRNDEIYSRYYSYYINELKEIIVTEYIDKLYLLLKKLL